jgi:nitrate reductase NapA
VTEPEHRRLAESIWNLPAGRINGKPGHHTVELWRRFSTPKDQGGDIDTIWVQVTNPARSLPNLGALFEPSRRIPGKFLIVSDVYPTATVKAADLVLPSAMWIEKNGMVGNSERRTQQWFKMVPPPGEARDDCWQTIAVARRLLDRGHPGLKDRDGKFLFDVADARGRAVPGWQWAYYNDVNVDEHLFGVYRRFTRKKHKDLAPYRAYVEARGLRWPVVQQPDGRWRETKFRFAKFDDPYATRAEIQFYHSVTATTAR